MKTQKLLVIVASVSLMAFFNASSFAQTAQEDPALTHVLASSVTKLLKAKGYDVVRVDDSVKFVDSEVIVPLPDIPEEKDSRSAENIDDFLLLKQCLDAADLIYDVTVKVCELNVTDFEDFICKTGATFDRVLSTLNCIALYVPQEPPIGDVVTVFATRSLLQADLGGLAGADLACQLSAKVAGLPGKVWTAWLSDSTENAIDRIPGGQYQLVNGTPIADDKDDLTDGRLNAAIKLNEFGDNAPGFAWTGTESDGTNTGNNCSNWTVNSSESGGDRGVTAEINDQWTKLIAAPAQCGEKYRLYCFGGVE